MWGTSPMFLDHFGIRSIDDLPGISELKSAGLLRKGQILGELGDVQSSGEDDDVELDDADLLSKDFEDSSPMNLKRNIIDLSAV